MVAQSAAPGGQGRKGHRISRGRTCQEPEQLTSMRRFNTLDSHRLLGSRVEKVPPQQQEPMGLFREDSWGGHSFLAVGAEAGRRTGANRHPVLKSAWNDAILVKISSNAGGTPRNISPCMAA